MVRVRVLEHPDAIDADAWNALGNDPLSRHEVLSAIADARLPGVRLGVAVLENTAGRLVAGAPLSEIAIDGERLIHGAFRSAVHAARHVYPGLLRTRVAICGTPLSVGNPPLRIARDVSPGPVLRRLGAALVDLADAEGASWRVFKELPRAALDDAAELVRAGWVLAPSEPDFVLRVPWRRFDAYLADLRHPYRYKIRKSARKLHAAGVRISDVPLSEGYDDAIHCLYENVFARAEVQLEKLNARFFTALGRRAGTRARLLRFELDGRVVGWVVLLWSGRTLIDLFHGIDYRVNGALDLYFNQLAAVIEYAITRGAVEIRLGQSCEVAKTRFGAAAEPRWIAIRHARPVVSRVLRRGRSALFPVRPVPERTVFREPMPAREVSDHEDPLRGQSAGVSCLAR